mgnify:CR=1 FL=1
MPKDIDQQIRRHHVIGKAKAGCSVAEIMAEQAIAFGDKAMSRAQVYDIVKKVKNGENMEDNRGKAVNKFVRTEEMINDVKRFIEEDRRVDVAQLASVFDVSTGTIFNILHDDLGLVKKSTGTTPQSTLLQLSLNTSPPRRSRSSGTRPTALTSLQQTSSCSPK